MSAASNAIAATARIAANVAALQSMNLSDGAAAAVWEIEAELPAIRGALLFAQAVEEQQT